MRCSICKKEFHYCSSCEPYELGELGCCSEKCADTLTLVEKVELAPEYFTEQLIDVYKLQNRQLEAIEEAWKVVKAYLAKKYPFDHGGYWKAPTAEIDQLDDLMPGTFGKNMVVKLRSFLSACEEGEFSIKEEMEDGPTISTHWDCPQCGMKGRRRHGVHFEGELKCSGCNHTWNPEEMEE